MSKIKLPLRLINLVLVTLCLSFSSFANSNAFIGEVSFNEIEERLDAISSDVDYKLTPEVKQYLSQYIELYRHSSEKLIGRSLYYFPLIENKINERSLPSEIKYLPIIESSLKPSARSRVGAVGLWQFMRATARMYGLTINSVVDERRDPEKSTDAALEYLSDLYDRFGDWTLALAAYNCGPGNVSKAMRRSGKDDYWGIQSYLPRETRYYVPKFIAMAYLMNYYIDHELEPQYPENLFVKTRKALVYETMSLKEISRISKVDVETIQFYNPSYVSGYVPKSEEGNVVILPSLKMYDFIANSEKDVNLVPDPYQDLIEETKVASQMFEKRELVEIIPLAKLEVNFELLSSESESDLARKINKLEIIPQLIFNDEAVEQREEASKSYSGKVFTRFEKRKQAYRRNSFALKD